MRILHVVSRSQRRGAELVAVELARGLDALGHSNRVAALGLGFDGGEQPGVTPLTRRTDGGAGALLAGARALRRTLHAEPADLVVAHGGRAVEAAVLVAVSTRRRDRPLIVWQRILGFPPEMWHPLPRYRWRAVVSRIDAAVALTPDLAEELRRLGFSQPIWNIANFRDPAPFAALDRDAAARQLRGELGLAPDVGLVGFVGHLIEQKRPDRAIDALATMHELGEPAHLALAGAGPLRATLERDVAGSGLGEYVHFLGHTADVARVLGAIDVFVLTSDSEGLPGVLIEAQMAGCAIVTVPVGGVRDLVDDGDTGIVVGAVDHDAIARAVVALLRDPERRRRLGTRAREASGRYALDRAAAVYASHFSELVDNRGG